jgi:glutamyl-tRNA synthetase
MLCVHKGLKKKGDMIRVRFAPSPTGYLHIGGARTALFNWMYARAQDGKFILRIEDTDQARSSDEFIDEILKGMEWLGLRWDELYRQSERFEIYRNHAEKLLKAGKAYREGEAVILKMPRQEIKLYDIIRGEILFDTSTLKDEVLIKSDGSPTYSFACVVDDALMSVSHVIRGEDHISNTPKQMMIYRALDFNVPKFAHLPLILGSDGGRLSKRTGAVAVSDYKRQGFLPEALVNYLMLLGWSPGNNQEMIQMDAAIKKFSIKKVNKTAATFSMEKLKWLNGQYIKQMPIDRLVKDLIPFLKEKGYIDDNYDKKRLEGIVQSYKSRMTTFIEFLERTEYLFVDKITMEKEAQEKYLAEDKTREFRLLSERLGGLKSYNVATAEEIFREVVAELGIQAGDLVHAVRVALTGQAVGIGLFETMVLLGKDRTIKRLKGVFESSGKGDRDDP